MKLRLLTLVILLIFIGNNIARSQQFKNQEVKFIIDSTVAIMQRNAVNSEKVNWNALKQQSLNDASSLNSPNELGKVIRRLFSAVNDFHGKFYYGDSIFIWRGRELVIPDSVMKQWNNRAGIKTGTVDQNIGYLRIPSILTGSKADINRKAQALNDSLCKILTPNTKGVILDLRIDGGGDMHPMILGIEQLLGNATVGGFNTKRKETWTIRDNKLYIDTLISAEIKPKCIVDAQSIPIVVLIGTGTGSSGEFLTMALKGRKKTVFIGTETAGYVTSVAGFSIGKVAYLNLSIGYGQDRTGKLYTTAIKPDIHLQASEKFNNITDDDCVKAAIKLINRK